MPIRNIHWMSVLRSCCSIEAYRRNNIGEMDPVRVATFLILEPDFPRSIQFCVMQAHEAIASIREEVHPQSIDPAERRGAAQDAARIRRDVRDPAARRAAVLRAHPAGHLEAAMAIQGTVLPALIFHPWQRKPTTRHVPPAGCACDTRRATSYDRPISRSIHRAHLRPMDDWKQVVVAYQLRVSTPVQEVEYEDVFGNWTTRFDINKPYKQLTITAESVVELLDVDPFAFAKLAIRPPSFPLVWMPWERTMLAPYLTPDELPDTQLQELYDYAMGFVKRNKGDLMETLFAINLSLFREYQYVPGCTSLDTSRYDVMISAVACVRISRICSSRLRGCWASRRATPADTSTPATASGASSDASHAWVQLYIPNIGWKASIRPTACCRTSITSASLTAATIATRRRPRAPSTRRRKRR